MACWISRSKQETRGDAGLSAHNVIVSKEETQSGSVFGSMGRGQASKQVSR